MAFTLISWGVFSIVLITLLGFISNSNTSNQTRINQNIAVITCPFPIANGVDHSPTNPGTNMTYDVDINGNSASISGGAIVGTFYRCSGANSGTFINIQTTIKQYGAYCFSVIPCGNYAYVVDYAGSFVGKIGALLSTAFMFITPIGFNILGFTLTDLPSQAELMVVIIYVFCYLGIFSMFYKVASMFAGAT